MPTEELPPPDPFPDVTADAPAPVSGAAEEVSLLSEAQRREFASVAGNFGDPGEPPAAVPAPAPAGPPVEHDFLLAPAGDDGAPAAALQNEQPVLEEDFIALPEPKPAAEETGESKPESLGLSALAAALTAPAASTGNPEPPAPAAALDLSEGDLPPLDLSRLVSPFTPVEPLDAAPAPEAPPEPVNEATASPPAEPASPIAIIAASAAASLPALEVEEKPEAAAKEAPPETKDAVPVIQFPPPRPEPAAAVEKPEPAAVEIEPLHPLVDADEAPDFDAPLLFPVPSVDNQGPQPVAAVEITNPHDRGVGMVLSGALLILLGVFLACRVPSLALDADAAAVSSHALAPVRAAHLQGEMLVSALGAGAFLLLGIGSATLRRWAPPLIHAAGWVVLLTVLVFMGAATAAMFHLSGNDTAGDAVPGNGTLVFAAAGIFGIALPLGFIALFQRPSVARLCELVDTKPRWTDRRSIPALMVFVAALLLATGAAAMAVAGVQFPLFGTATTAPAAAQEWGAVAAAALIAAGLTAWGKRAGWWLLLMLSLALATALFLTCREHDWKALAGLPGAGSGSLSGAVLAAVSQLPVLLILLMTRRAFSHSAATH